MRIDVIRGSAAHRLCADSAFRAAWMQLRSLCPWATTFQEPAFVCIWYACFHQLIEPILVRATDASGRLTGLLPLCFSPEFGLEVAGQYHAEYHAWICRPEDVIAFGAAALRAVRPLIPGRSSLHFQYLPPGMPVSWLAATEPQRRLDLSQGPTFGILRTVQRPILRLGDGKDVLDSLRKSSNKSKIKRLEKLGKLTFRQITDPEEFDRIFDRLIDAYDLRHAAVHGVAPFRSNPLKRDFHCQLMRAPGVLHATVTTVGDTVAAFHLGAPSNRELQLGITVHNPWLSKHSPAKIHMLLLSKMLLEQGFEKFDLTPGGDAYKRRFANDWDTVHTLSVYGSAHAQALGQLGFDAMDKARQVLEQREMSTSDARAKVERIRRRVHPAAVPQALRAAGVWARGSTQTRIYSLDVAKIRDLPAPATAVLRDDPSAPLDCPIVTRWKTRRDLASEATARFEAGMHLYSIREGGSTCSLGWLAERPTEDLLATALPGYTLPADSAMACDLFTSPAHRNRGHGHAILTAILRDAAAVPGTQRVILPVPAACPAAVRLVERLGASLEATIVRTTRWGKVRHEVTAANAAQGESAAAPATPAASPAAAANGTPEHAISAPS